MSKNVTLMLVFIPALLTGCASPDFSYNKPGVSQAQMDEDVAECRRAAQRMTSSGPANSSPTPDGKAGLMRSVDMKKAEACMQDKGYTTEWL